MYVRWIMTAAATVALSAALGVAVTRAHAAAESPPNAFILPVTGAERLPPRPSVPTFAFGDTMLGASGALRAHFASRAEVASLALGDTAPPSESWSVPGGIDGHPFTFLPMRPFHNKLGSWIGEYLVGYWPAERRRIRSSAYANPSDFIEVTPANEDTYVSEHFRLRDFLTHDQANVWPKYLVLREALLDKLELVLTDLAHRGIDTHHVIVLSGFRTPAYNMALGDASGRARESRHQYGDAADIIIDADGDGRMDDLNLDGRVDERDVRVIERAVERVEHEYPELAGGLGLYDAMGPHGPFAHIDVRGEVKRWTRSARTLAAADNTRASRVGACYATGPSAALCVNAHRH
jgi:uncharacterized protein YcbK (DUF882 family)